MFSYSSGEAAFSQSFDVGSLTLAYYDLDSLTSSEVESTDASLSQDDHEVGLSQ